MTKPNEDTVPVEKDIFSKEEWDSLHRSIHAGKLNRIGCLNEFRRLRTKKEAAVKEAKERGRRDGLREALETLRLLCRNDCDAYRDVFGTIQKAADQAKESK